MHAGGGETDAALEAALAHAHIHEALSIDARYTNSEFQVVSLDICTTVRRLAKVARAAERMRVVAAVEDLRVHHVLPTFVALDELRRDHL